MWTIVSLYTMAETDDAEDDFALADIDDDDTVTFEEVFMDICVEHTFRAKIFVFDKKNFW